jgi:NADH-quinone oxidoreductase subunit M
MLSDRRHTRLISEFGGLKAVVPRLVAAFLVITLASIALPGTNGFVGEFLILIGSFRWDMKLTAFAATGVILSAVYMLWMFQRVNYGPVTNEKNRHLHDLTPREWALVAPTVAMCIVMGVVPGVFLKPMEPAVYRVVERVSGAAGQAGVSRPAPAGPAEGDPRAAEPGPRPAIRAQANREP